MLLLSTIAFSQNWSGYRNGSSLHYNLTFESGYTFGIGEWGQSAFKIDLINGGRISFYSIGVGLGIRAFNLNYHERKTGRADSAAMDPSSQASLYLDNRVELPGRRIKPYLAFGIGASFLPGGFSLFSGPSLDASLFISTSAGVNWRVLEKLRLFGGVVYESYDVKYFEIANPHNYFLKRSKSIGFTVGISFTP